MARSSVSRFDPSVPAVIKPAGRIVQLAKPQAEIALRVIHTEKHNQLMDQLKGFKDRLNSKGLPDSRGDRIYEFVQGQIYTAFGLTPNQRKALKGDSKAPLLDLLTQDQIMAVYQVKARLIGIYQQDAETGIPRDATNAKVKKAIASAVEYYGYAFGK